MITGTGLCTPLGLSGSQTWTALTEGRTAARGITTAELQHWEQLEQLTGFAPAGCPVDHSSVKQHLFERPPLPGSAQIPDHWMLEPTLSMTTVALHDACDHAQLNVAQIQAAKAGVCIGSSKGSLRAAEHWYSARRLDANNRRLQTTGPHTISGFPLLTDNAAKLTARLLQIQGPVQVPVAACASGLLAILQAARLISSGVCDLCVAGAADASLRPEILASFHRLGVTSRSRPAETACKPFDQHRDGFLIGEGAGILILESRRHAQARGARPLCQIVAGTWASDPTGITQVDESGNTIARLLQEGTRLCGQVPDVIGFHGTGTSSNDLAEARGVIQTAPAAICYATKGATGHLLGASGAVEAGLQAIAIQKRLIPGSRNHETADPAFREIRVTGGCVAAPHDALWARLSLGFGGHAGAAFFRPVR